VCIVSCISQLQSDELTKYNLPLFAGDDNINDSFSLDKLEDYEKGKGKTLTKTVQGRSEITRRRRRTKK
jgi:hypothetical protein